MKPYYEHNGIVIYHGDCREILPHVSADSIAAFVPQRSRRVLHSTVAKCYRCRVQSATVAERQKPRRLQGLLSELLAELEALTEERNAALEKVEQVTQTLDFERARQRRHLRSLRAAVEADMAEGRRVMRTINPLGAERVQAWMQSERRSQRWLAAEVEVTDVHLGLVLRGERQPSPALLERISAVTDIALGDLLPVEKAVAS